MSEIVVLKRTFVSRLRNRLPTRCQKRYARCGRPPESRDPKTTSATPRSIGSINAGTSAGSYSRSASWITATSPSTCGIAARTADPLPEWQESAVAAEWIEPGKRFRERRSFLGRTAELELEVTACEPNRRFDVKS